MIGVRRKQFNASASQWRTTLLLLATWFGLGAGISGCAAIADNAKPLTVFERAAIHSECGNYPPARIRAGGAGRKYRYLACKQTVLERESGQTAASSGVD
tara:strand:- start:2020 stop:2319 length:300 start_codon:yes stop_codon:yes gene_type:complete